jgi:hypothetical protein
MSDLTFGILVKTLIPGCCDLVSASREAAPAALPRRLGCTSNQNQLPWGGPYANAEAGCLFFSAILTKRDHFTLSSARRPQIESISPHFLI